jgi:hypothetical protein
MSRRRPPIALPVASSNSQRLAWSGLQREANVQTTPMPNLGTQL